MTEEAIIARTAELKKQGFVRVVHLNFREYFPFVIISFILACVFWILFFAKITVVAKWFSLSESVFQMDLCAFATIFTALTVWGSFVYFPSQIRFRRQMKKWFEDEDVDGFFALAPREYGFQIYIILSEDFKDLKQFLAYLRQVNAVFIRMTWDNIGERKEIIQNELSFLKNVQEKERKRFLSEMGQVKSGHIAHKNIIKVDRGLAKVPISLKP
jgi:hypothetical protein